MKSDDSSLKYSAKESYQNDSVPINYEQERYSSLFGRYIYGREQRAVSKLVDMLPSEISIADCPCGNGRWWPMLAKKAQHIIALDVSQGMLNYASSQKSKFDIEIEVKEGDAENLCLEDNSVDYVFSHALTKHLPIPIQYKVLSEFSRVARLGVICSFGIFTHFSYEFWRHRNLKESYPTFKEELEWMAAAANLKIKKMHKCTSPIGVEHTVLFEKIK
jgi:ubiquinone/menaquinone biosynthesis C-methylase UbiE